MCVNFCGIHHNGAARERRIKYNSMTTWKTWKKVEFKGSFTKLAQLPTNSVPEISFIGRSNVGKSSLINALAGRKNLAKVSGTPGKTRTLNYFLVNDAFYLVDLPGYGYAKVAKTDRKAFQNMVYDYLFQRSNMVCTFVLLDLRINPMEKDMDFINLLAQKQVPQCFIFTKADKLKKQQRARQYEKYQQTLLKYWEELPPRFISSSKTGEGVEELINFISQMIEEIRE
jgi:GTP-binding protein